MSRKSREAVAMEENDQKIAAIEAKAREDVKLLRAVNDALQTMIDARKKLVPMDAEGNR